MKRNLQTGLCLAAILSLAHAPALAHELEWSLEATLSSDYIDAGESLSDGRPALILGAEAEASGFFAGFELATIRDGDDRIEIVPFLGYRHDFDPVELEIGLERAWANDSGWDDLELFAGIEWAVNHRFTLGAEAVYDLSGREWAELALTGEYAFNDRLSLSATLGRLPADGFDYANVGVTYEVTDRLAAELRLHNSDEIGTRLALSLTAALGN